LQLQTTSLAILARSRGPPAKQIAHWRSGTIPSGRSCLGFSPNNEGYIMSNTRKPEDAIGSGEPAGSPSDRQKPEDGIGSGKPAGPPSDIFDNLAALRLEPDAGTLVGAVEVLAHVPIRKPSPTEWVRVHPGANMTLATSFYVDRENREIYLVVPEMREV